MKRRLFLTLIIFLLSFLMIYPISAKEINTNLKESSIFTKLEDGTYKVKLLIPDDLKDKSLLAVYVDQNKDVDKHDVTIEGEYATFIAHNFNNYLLADKNNLKAYINPPTGDEIMPYVLVSAASIFGIIGIGAYFYKRMPC